MKRPLVIFGAGEIAQLAHWYFSHDSEYDVVGFTVDSEYLSDNSFCGLPLLAFETATKDFSPESCEIFVALSYAELNGLRKRKYLAAKAAGYSIASYISSRACILNDFSIGENCFILEDNTIQPYSRIGNNVTMWSGNHLGHHSVIRDHCFLASHIVISGGVEIEESCFVGVNATIRDHVRIGERCIVGAGALIVENAEPEGVYMGARTVRSRVPSTRIRRI